MSAAKAMWALYEDPELDLAAAVKDPDLIPVGKKAKLALVATSFGSGAQNSPFAVLKDDAGADCALNSFRLLPELSVTDAQFTKTLSPAQVKACGLSTLSQALRAFASRECSEFTQGLLREAIGLVLQNLSAAESGCPQAREKLHNAAAIAGAAYGNVPVTVDPDAPPYPTDAELAADAQRTALLAEELGFADAQGLLDACKALA
jgi:acetaldehyde dehydrogenase/alcohol dehydrogenase